MEVLFISSATSVLPLIQAVLLSRSIMAAVGLCQRTVGPEVGRTEPAQYTIWFRSDQLCVLLTLLHPSRAIVTRSSPLYLSISGQRKSISFSPGQSLQPTPLHGLRAPIALKLKFNYVRLLLKTFPWLPNYM